MHSGVFIALLILTITVPVVAIFRFAGIPSMLAYLLIGATVSQYQLDLVQHNESLSKIADFGVVFLMFTIGLEFSFARLKSMRKLVLGMGAAQVVLTTSATMFFAMLIGFSWQAGLALGGVIAMSSTAIVARLLTERLEVHTAHGRQVIGVLLFQDIAVVPLLILLPSLASSDGGLWLDLGLSIGKASVALAVIFFLGQRLIQPLFVLVTYKHSRELFMLNVLWIVLGMATLTEFFGISLALGAFLGGMLISETAYRHQVASDIRPFRDILLGLFFITIGMELNLQLIANDAVIVLAIVAGLLVVKAFIVLIISMAIRSNLVTAMRAALQLSFAGEFGFVLLNQAGELKLIDDAVLQPVLAAMLISMMIGPILVHRSRELVKMVLGKSVWVSDGDLEQISAQSRELSQHVIVCGYGRTGKSLIKHFEQEHVSYVALELDGMLVNSARQIGENVLFGDAAKSEVLQAVGIERAVALVITHNDLGSAMRTLNRVQMLRSDLPVIVRTEDRQSAERIKKAGATDVVPEVEECSLVLAAQTLQRIGTTEESLHEVIGRLRGEG
jgi:CPA2 family monovalent cation:H+ antiporter-2